VNFTVSPAIGLRGLNVNDAFGLMLTTTLTAVAFVAPRSSVTWRRTVCEPAVGNEVVTVDAVPLSNVPLLSRSHACETILPSGSDEVDFRLTVWPTSGADGVKVIDALGGRLGTTVMAFVAELDSAGPGGTSVLVTFSVIVKVPGPVYV